MDRKDAGELQVDDWWDRLTPMHKRAINILHAQLSGQLRKMGFNLSDEELATVTIQLATYAPGKKLLLGQKSFDSPEALAEHIIEVHPGLKPGKTFSEF